MHILKPLLITQKKSSSRLQTLRFDCAHLVWHKQHILILIALIKLVTGWVRCSDFINRFEKSKNPDNWPWQKQESMLDDMLEHSNRYPLSTRMLHGLPWNWHSYTILSSLCLGEGGGPVSPLPASIQRKPTVQHWFHSIHAVSSAGLTHRQLGFL